MTATAEARAAPAAAPRTIAYRTSRGVDDFVRQLAGATPLQQVEAERTGVPGSFLKDLSKRMDIPATRVFTMVGVPKATAERKAAAGEMLSGHSGQAAIGMARLLGIAQALVADSTSPQAKNFDSAKWLGQWLERPQPALGGRKPGDLVDTPTGIEIVARLLGAIESGAYR
jgi:putative toxin-antitoxin system antitoxin component (TIGR02293 family)